MSDLSQADEGRLAAHIIHSTFPDAVVVGVGFARQLLRDLAAANEARERAESELICDVCLNLPLPSGKPCVCNGTGGLQFTLQGTRETLFDA